MQCATTVHNVHWVSARDLLKYSLKSRNIWEFFHLFVEYAFFWRQVNECVCVDYYVYLWLSRIS